MLVLPGNIKKNIEKNVERNTNIQQQLETLNSNMQIIYKFSMAANYRRVGKRKILSIDIVNTVESLLNKLRGNNTTNNTNNSNNTTDTTNNKYLSLHVYTRLLIGIVRIWLLQIIEIESEIKKNNSNKHSKHSKHDTINSTINKIVNNSSIKLRPNLYIDDDIVYESDDNEYDDSTSINICAINGNIHSNINSDINNIDLDEVIELDDLFNIDNMDNIDNSNIFNMDNIDNPLIDNMDNIDNIYNTPVNINMNIHNTIKIDKNTVLPIYKIMHKKLIRNELIIPQLISSYIVSNIEKLMNGTNNNNKNNSKNNIEHIDNIEITRCSNNYNDYLELNCDLSSGDNSNNSNNAIAAAISNNNNDILIVNIELFNKACWFLDILFKAGKGEIEIIQNEPFSEIIIVNNN